MWVWVGLLSLLEKMGMFPINTDIFQKFGCSFALKPEMSRDMTKPTK